MKTAVGNIMLKHVTHRQGENVVTSKITEEQAKKIIWVLENKIHSISQISEIFGVSKSIIKAISSGRTWKHLREVGKQKSNPRNVVIQ